MGWGEDKEKTGLQFSKIIIKLKYWQLLCSRHSPTSSVLRGCIYWFNQQTFFETSGALWVPANYSVGLPWWLRGKEPECQCRRLGLDPWVGKIPWRRKCQPIPVFLPQKAHDRGAWQATVHWGLKKTGQNLGTKQQHTTITQHAQDSQRSLRGWSRTHRWKLPHLK